jgi:replication factor C large subunit
MIQRIAGPASRSTTFSGRRRLVILDEADNLPGTADRGGAAAMLRLVRETGQPVLLIANEYYEIDKALRDAAKGIQFRSLRATTVAQALRGICQAEGVECEADALMLIAERAGGDMRSAINDLQAAAEGESAVSVEDVATAERDVKSSIFKVLEVIFKGSNSVEALQASYDLDESPEDLINWVDENLPLAYSGADLWRGYESLARADMFLGRVRVRQNYGLWRYAGFLMTGGVQAARAERRHGYVAFRPPSLWRRMGQTRKARSVRDAAAKKIGARCHVSAAFARSELMGFVGLLLSDKKKAAPLAAELGLEAEEIALLLGSSPSTKKVQSIFEEAQRIREAEEFQEIELGWQGTAQRSLGHAPQAALAEGALEVALTAAAKPEGAAPVEPARAESAPAGGPEGDEKPAGGPEAAVPARKRGRPKKTEGGEKKETKGGAREGKRQKSLFDF